MKENLSEYRKLIRDNEVGANATLKDLAALADKKMYEVKNAYHAGKGEHYDAE